MKFQHLIEVLYNLLYDTHFSSKSTVLVEDVLWLLGLFFHGEKKKRKTLRKYFLI